MYYCQDSIIITKKDTQITNIGEKTFIAAYTSSQSVGIIINVDDIHAL